MLLSELAARTGATLAGDGAIDIVRVATLESGGPGAIAFLANPKYRQQLATTRAAAVIVDAAAGAQTALPRLVTGNPYATFAKVAAILNPIEPVPAGVHPSAVVAASARVAASASIGPHAVIGAGATIGERTRIGALCSIGDGASIGDDALLHPRVTVYARCVIGPRAIVHTGAVIGADGFGMAEEDGRWLKIPQVGRVVVGADVEIGANTTIDRGAIDDTIIEDDVKLDNQIQIGHNCRIGAHTAIAACTGIAGSTRIGRNCKIGGAVMINGHIEICDGAIVTPASGIMRSIDKPGVYSSFPSSLPHTEWRRVLIEIHGLRTLSARVRRLEKNAGQTTPAAREESEP